MCGIKKSIKVKIILVVVVSLILSTIINTSLSMSGYSKVASTSVKGGLINGVDLYRKNIAQSFEHLVNSFETSGLIQIVANHQDNSMEEQKEQKNQKDQNGPNGPNEFDGNDIINKVLQEHSAYMFEISVVNFDGIVTLSTNQSNLDTIVDTKAVNAIQDGSSYHLGAYEEYEDGKGFQLYMPLKDMEGNLQGVIVAKMSVAYLAHIISDSREYTEEMYLGVHPGLTMEEIGEVSMYIMDETGTLLVDMDPDYVGKTMPSELFQNFYRLSRENTESPSGLYDTTFEGNSQYYMAYSWMEQGDWYIVLEVSSDKLLSSLKSVNKFIYISTIVLLLIVLIFAYIIARNISRPIEKTTEVLRHMANLDFKSIDIDNISNKQDETGAMAESIQTVVVKLQEIFGEMGSSTVTIHGSSGQLNDISQMLEENAKENLAIAQELVASMDQSVATFEELNQGVFTLQNGSQQVTDQLTENVDLCNKMLDTVTALSKSTVKATEETKEVYAKIRAEVDTALIGAKAVDKVNTLANAIMDIAGQTRLLALNASIEAARAGEAGRGFAVVAEEIGNLANQSTEIVSNITQITNEINISVSRMKHSLETSLTFMEHTVLSDYEKFTSVSTKYSEESIELRDEICNIATMIHQLVQLLGEMSTGIHTTTIRLEDSNKGTAVLVEKNSEIAEISTRTFDMAVENKEQLEKLAKLLEQVSI